MEVDKVGQSSDGRIVPEHPFPCILTRGGGSYPMTTVLNPMMVEKKYYFIVSVTTMYYLAYRLTAVPPSE